MIRQAKNKYFIQPKNKVYHNRGETIILYFSCQFSHILHFFSNPHSVPMKNKFESIVIIVLPIIAAFGYVVAEKIMEEASFIEDPRLYHQFYFIVISTAIYHLFWLVMCVLICQNAFENLRIWRVLTTFLVLQTILLYGLAVYFSLFLSAQVYLRDIGVNNSNLDYYITWSAVSVGCLWGSFIVFLILVIKHIYAFEELGVVKVDDVSRMP